MFFFFYFLNAHLLTAIRFNPKLGDPKVRKNYEINNLQTNEGGTVVELFIFRHLDKT